MDPKTQLSGLDPKLKEAYERVMGTTIPPASPPPVPPQEPAVSVPTGQTEPVPPKEPVSPPPAQEPIQEPTPPPVAPPQPPEPAAPPLQQPEPPPIPPVQPPVIKNEPVSSPAQPTGFVANAAKKGKLAGLKISPPILMAVGVAFLALYIFFWMRVFNLSLF